MLAAELSVAAVPIGWTVGVRNWWGGHVMVIVRDFTVLAILPHPTRTPVSCLIPFGTSHRETGFQSGKSTLRLKQIHLKVDFRNLKVTL